MENYVKKGEPVSSKTICDTLEMSVSSATVRNELSGLTAIGLLEQIHTSSGRVPSDLGYRVYINKVMHKKPISVCEQKMIDQALRCSAKDPGSLLKDASCVLAQLTKCAVASVMPIEKRVNISAVQLIRVSLRSAMVILVTSSGIIRNRMFCCDYYFTPDLIQMFQNILDKKFSNVPIKNVTPAFIQTIAASLYEVAIIMSPVLMSVFESVEDLSDVEINLEGTVNLLFTPEFKEGSVRNILRFLEQSENVAELLLHNNRSLQVLVGRETNIQQLYDLSVIISKYKVYEHSFGAIAVIGPTRMDYAKFISSLEYMSGMLEKILGDILS